MALPPIPNLGLSPFGALAQRSPEPSEKKVDDTCPVCGAPLLHEKCKVLCKSAQCVYRIVFNCSEF